MEATVVTRMLFSRSPLAGLALCVAALVNLVAPSLIRAGVVACGDVNGDGVVNIGDALIVAQYDVGLRACGQGQFSHPEVCDVNGDAACNIGDALRIAQCNVGLISCAFTCGPFTCPSTTSTTTTTPTSSQAPTTTTTSTRTTTTQAPTTTTSTSTTTTSLVLLNRSMDGGLTWGHPVVVKADGDFNDKNWTVCDNTTSSPFYGNCYTEFDDATLGDLVQMSTSPDGGLTWGPALATADGAHGIGGQPLVQPSGRVVVPIVGLDSPVL